MQTRLFSAPWALGCMDEWLQTGQGTNSRIHIPANLFPPRVVRDSSILAYTLVMLLFSFRPALVCLSVSLSLFFSFSRHKMSIRTRTLSPNLLWWSLVRQTHPFSHGIACIVCFAWMEHRKPKGQGDGPGQTGTSSGIDILFFSFRFLIPSGPGKGLGHMSNSSCRFSFSPSTPPSLSPSPFFFGLRAVFDFRMVLLFGFFLYPYTCSLTKSLVILRHSL